MQAAPARPPVATAAGRRLSLVLGVILAVVAFLGVALLAIYVSSQNNAGNATVVVTTRDVSARETFSADMLTTQTVPNQGLQPGHYVKPADLVGKSAAVPIPKGQQVTSNMLFANSGIQTATSAYLPIPKGWVARAIPTGELQGVAGYVQAGDYINVITAVAQSQFNTKAHPTDKTAQISKTTFTNVRVIAVGPAGKASGNGVSSSMTIILTECDAEYFDWLLNNTKLTYTVLSYKDYGPAPTAPVASCPPTTSTGVGPDQLDSRFHFTQV
jgi:Flp pilus assembly protein CpaB